MKKIEHYKSVFHLTSTNNFENILKLGLLSRSKLDKNFYDIADKEIIELRKRYELDKYIPFHFFPKNPFDGRVQRNNPTQNFMFLALNKKFINKYLNNFYIIPSHPLHLYKINSLRIYNYNEGIHVLNWDLMNLRNFSNNECKQACMSECITDLNLNINDFNYIAVKDKNIKENLENKLRLYNREYGKNINIYINIIPEWFINLYP